MQRTRECNGPSYGGSECHGGWKETSNCFLKECPGKIRHIDIHYLAKTEMPQARYRVHDVKLLLQLMDAGTLGAHGAAAARLVVEATSRGREFVKGLSLVESLAPVTWESRDVAMRRDALVSS